MNVNDTKRDIQDKKESMMPEEFKEWCQSRVTMMENDITDFGETPEDMARLKLYKQALNG